MKLLTVGLLAGGAGLLLLGYKAAKDAAENFSFEITGYGRPTLKGYELSVPLKVKANNPTAIPINIDQLDGEIYLNKMGTWVLAGKVLQPVSLQPGVTENWIFPAVNLSNIFGGDLVQTISAALEIQRTKKVELRADIGGTYGPLTIPKQSFTQTVDL